VNEHKLLESGLT